MSKYKQYYRVSGPKTREEYKLYRTKMIMYQHLGSFIGMLREVIDTLSDDEIGEISRAIEEINTLLANRKNREDVGAYSSPSSRR